MANFALLRVGLPLVGQKRLCRRLVQVQDGHGAAVVQDSVSRSAAQAAGAAGHDGHLERSI